jgi:hypothetical protein
LLSTVAATVVAERGCVTMQEPTTVLDVMKAFAQPAATLVVGLVGLFAGAYLTDRARQRAERERQAAALNRAAAELLDIRLSVKVVASLEKVMALVGQAAPSEILAARLFTKNAVLAAVEARVGQLTQILCEMDPALGYRAIGMDRVVTYWDGLLAASPPANEEEVRLLLSMVSTYDDDLLDHIRAVIVDVVDHLEHRHKAEFLQKLQDQDEPVETVPAFTKKLDALKKAATIATLRQALGLTTPLKVPPEVLRELLRDGRRQK